MSTEIIYTDGACNKNGTPRSTGGFGLFIARSSISSKPIKINCKGKHMEYNGDTLYVTNIRMEGLAIVAALALYADVLINNIPSEAVNVVKRLNECKPFKLDGLKTTYAPNELKTPAMGKSTIIEIVTDSLFWINVIESWMPGWVRKGVMAEKKNPDILLMIRYYTELFKQNCVTIVLTHVRSHQKGKRTAHADGNDVADVLAATSVNNFNNDFCAQ